MRCFILVVLALGCSSESLTRTPFPASDAGADAPASSARAEVSRPPAAPDAAPERDSGPTVEPRDDAATEAGSEPEAGQPEASTGDVEAGPEAAPEPDATPPVVEPEPEPEAGPTEPALDPCGIPSNGSLLYDCDQVCGGTDIDCNACNGFLDSVPAYFVFGDGAPCGTDCDPGYRFPVPSGKCVKLTVQPGAHATFGGACGENMASDCIVVSSAQNGSMQPRTIHMNGPDRPAWVRYEPSNLFQGECYLTCP